MLRAIQKRSLPDGVLEQLTQEIVSGGYAPGAAIPSERELSALLGVNRHVVREAIKRLEQLGLVRVIQGGRTTVLDYRQTAGLDLLALLAEHAEDLEPLLPLLGATLEMRAGIGAEVARLCAQRAGVQTGGRLVELAERLAACASGPQLLELDQEFWQLILDGAGNLAYQLAFNSLIRAVHARVELSLPWLEAELARCDHRRGVATAIAAADPDGAARAARAALVPPPDFAATSAKAR